MNLRKSPATTTAPEVMNVRNKVGVDETRTSTRIFGMKFIGENLTGNPSLPQVRRGPI